MSTTIFFTGATGYIGGACLQLLLDVASFHITALVRSEGKARKLNSLGVTTIVGSLDDLDNIKDAASKADVVFNTADSDHYPAIMAILDGMKQRHDRIGKVPILIHTSGTSMLGDDARGMRGTETVYSDDDAAKLESLPITASHRKVDLQIVAADKEGFVKTYIVVPSTVWGTSTGRLVDMGIANKHSIQMPASIRESIARGQGGVVGAGENTWPHVEIHETAHLFMVVLRAALAGSAPHGREGYFFGENGQYRLIDAARAYTQVLHRLGKSKTSEPKPWTEAELDKQAYFGGRFLGANSRARGVRGRVLGWSPVKTTADFLDSLATTTEEIVNESSARGQQ